MTLIETQKRFKPTEQKRTVVHDIGILDAEIQAKSALDDCVESDFDLILKWLSCLCIKSYKRYAACVRVRQIKEPDFKKVEISGNDQA